MTVNAVLSQLVQRNDLSQKESRELVTFLTQQATPSQIAGLLTALASKGEEVEEIVGFIKGMREKVTTVAVPKGSIDVCGTGGDGKHTFNISTAAAFVLAGGGVSVAKHGNRAASSNCGSADVLEALGVRITLTSSQAETVLKKVGLVFLFAPVFHQSFKEVGMVRKELGIRTIFNYIGPFASPAGVERQVIGVPSKAIALRLAAVAQQLSYAHVCIITSEDGMDEASIFTKTQVYEIKGRKIREYVIDPNAYGFTKAQITDIQGADAQTNAAIIEAILSGKKGPQLDIVLLNSALGFVVAGKVTTIEEGITLAKESIDTGAALQVLHNLRKETQKYA